MLVKFVFFLWLFGLFFVGRCQKDKISNYREKNEYKKCTTV